MTTDLLTDTTIAEIKRELTHARPDTAIIRHLVQSTNAIGEVVDTWPSVSSTVPCRLTVIKRKEAVIVAEGYPQVAASSLWRCTFADDADVQYGDRIEINSVRYDVLTIEDAGDWRVALRVILHRPEAQ